MRPGHAPAIARSTALLALLAALASPALAEDRPVEVRAVTVHVPPFVMERDGQLTGFSIDLWNEIASRLQLKTSYRVVPDTDAMTSALLRKEADVAATAAFYTLERDR